MKALPLILIFTICLNQTNSRILAVFPPPLPAFKPAPPRKTFLTWDSVEKVNRQNDRQQCFLRSPREYDRNAPR